MNTKVCKVCQIEKGLDCFHKHKEHKLGVNNNCKICVSLRNKARYPEIRDEMLRQKAEQYREDPRKFLDRNKKHDPEKRKSERAAWVEKNRSYVVAKNAERRALRHNATPPWLTEDDKKAIKDIYKMASEMTLAEGVIYHVDHIIPLQGENVRGLHVPWNLQILPAYDNLSKGNRLE